MAETATTTRRWNSFVCPGCRFVFRVPQDHDGQGVVCPGCKIMLRLPAPGEDPGPLVVQKAAPEPVVEEEDDHDHEDHDRSGPHEEEEGGIGRLVVMMAVPGVLLLGLFAWMMTRDRGDTAPTASAPVAEEAAGKTEDAPFKPVATDLVQMEASAKGFLEAPTWEDAFRWVYLPEKVRPKAEAWYAARPYKTPGFRETSVEPILLPIGESEIDVVGLDVQTADYVDRQLALVRTPEGYRVDWESWAGWSESSWEDFKKERPTEPKLFRVICSPTTYYNFSFKDEARWVSFRLESLDRDEFLYGYSPVGDVLTSRLSPLDGVKERSVILKLRFPAGAETDNQVIIDGIVGTGWVDLPTNP